MPDLLETNSPEIQFENFEKKTSEYTFVYNPALIKKAKRDMAAVFVFSIALYIGLRFTQFSFWKNILSDPLPLVAGLAFAVSMSIPSLVTSFVYNPRLRIVVNRNGISCSGFRQNHMPEHSDWNDFSQIRWTNLPIITEKHARHTIVFIQRLRQYLLPTRHRNDETFVGVGHTLTLQQAIEVYAGKIPELSDTERKSVSALTANIDLGKKAGQVAYLALGIVIVTVVLMFLPDHPHLLDSPAQPAIYWIFGLASSALAYWYIRNGDKNNFTLIPIVLLGGAVAFLLLPLMGYASSWLGKEEQIVFSIFEDSDPKQQWQSVSDPEQTFTIYARRGRRTYQGIGTEHTMTVYRGPGMLSAIPHHEFQALSQQ